MIEKYEVLIFLIIYALAIAVTTLIFGVATDVYSWEKLPGMTTYLPNPVGGVGWIFGLFTFDIIGVPIFVRVLLMSPVIILGIYFIYVNFPLPLLNRNA